jgi:2-aminoadipate transaminase
MSGQMPFPFAPWASRVEPSALQTMLVEASRPDVVSFALGLPAPELFPVADYAAIAAEVLCGDPRALQYGPPFRPLITHIVELMRARGVECRESQIFLTAGAQQGLSLLARLLLIPGGAVLLEELTYAGMRQALEPFEPYVIDVPADVNGDIDLDALEARLASTMPPPRLLYVMSDAHNPRAASLTREARMRLAELARRFRVPLIEDDAYGFLSYDGRAEAPIRAYEDEWVMYVGSFSKTFAPGLRLGWLVVPERIQMALSVAKEAADINTATFSQRLAAAYLDSGRFEPHVARLRAEYRVRRDTMEAALRRGFGTAAHWRTPSAGVFLWVRLADVETNELLRAALAEERVAFVPGEAFAARACPWARAWLRLNYSHCAPAAIDDGIARLARAWRRLTGTSERAISRGVAHIVSLEA